MFNPLASMLAFIRESRRANASLGRLNDHLLVDIGFEPHHVSALLAHLDRQPRPRGNRLRDRHVPRQCVRVAPGPVIRTEDETRRWDRAMEHVHGAERGETPANSRMTVRREVLARKEGGEAVAMLEFIGQGAEQPERIRAEGSAAALPVAN